MIDELDEVFGSELFKLSFEGNSKGLKIFTRFGRSATLFESFQDLRCRLRYRVQKMRNMQKEGGAFPPAVKKLSLRHV